MKAGYEDEFVQDSEDDERLPQEEEKAETPQPVAEPAGDVEHELDELKLKLQSGFEDKNALIGYLSRFHTMIGKFFKTLPLINAGFPITKRI